MPDETPKKRRRQKKAFVTVKVGNKTYRGDKIEESASALVVQKGNKRVYINRATAPVIEVTMATGLITPIARFPAASPSAPQVSGGMHEINRRKAAAANAELENMMGPDFSQPIADDPAVE